MKFNGLINKLSDTWEKKFAALPDEEKKKMEAYIYITITLFTVSFFGFFAILPTLNTVSNLNKQFSDNKIVFNSLRKKLNDLQLLSGQYSQLGQDRDLIYNAIPKSAQIPKFTRQIEEIASLNGVNITTLSIGNIEIYPNLKKNDIYSFTFTVGAEGSQNGINSFNQTVINFERIIGVEKITTGKDEKKYTSSITGRAYFSNQ